MKKAQARKIKQSVARERRNVAKNFVDHILKPKPKYMPQWLWAKLVRLVVRL